MNDTAVGWRSGLALVSWSQYYIRPFLADKGEIGRDNATIGWTLRERVRAHLGVLVKRILRR